MQLITTNIEIAASPEVVRQKFLDFPRWPNFHRNGFFKSVVPADNKNPIDMVPGDILTVVIEFGTLTPVLRENTPESFIWNGNGMMGMFNGEHAFRFMASAVTPGGTTLVHEERFTGAMTWCIGEGAVAGLLGVREKTRLGFEGFNEDLKKVCEGI